MIDYKSLRKIFNDHKCALLSNEESLDLNLLSFVCSCDKESCNSLDDFKKNKNCGSCIKISGVRKLTYAFIKQQFENYSCILHPFHNSFVIINKYFVDYYTYCHLKILT